MVSDRVRAERLLTSRRRIGRTETILLSLAAVALALGAAAWVADIGDSTPLVTASLPPANTPSFDDRFASLSGNPQARDLGLRTMERSALNAVQLKLRDAKAMLAEKLQGDEWRSTLTDDDRHDVYPNSGPATANGSSSPADVAGPNRMLRGLYYGSYKEPREVLWILGVIIYLLMMATGFMGSGQPHFDVTVEKAFTSRE